MTKLALTALALALAPAATEPAAAQSEPSVSCLAETAEPGLSSALVEGVLADEDIEDQPEAIQDDLLSSSITCMFANDIETGRAEEYFGANLAYMMAEEFKRRLVNLGVEMAATEDALTQVESNRELDVGNYIDARPDQFAIPIEQIARRNGIEAEEIFILIGGYIGSRMEQKANAAAFLAR